MSGFRIYKTNQGRQGEEYLEETDKELTSDLSEIPLCKVR